MSWRQIVEPEATVWRRIAEKARGHGLVHGSKAIELTGFPGVNRGPADADNLLADMVEMGELTPCKLDMAGANRSQMAFRSAGPSAGAGTEDAAKWSQEQATLWTYTSAK